MIRIYFGGIFFGLGLLTTLFLGAVYNISADIRNMKQPARWFLCWLLFLLVHKSPLEKAAIIIVLHEVQAERTVSAVAKSPKVSGGLNYLLAAYSCCGVVEEINHASKADFS